MSSSAPKRQLVAEVSPFAYAEAGLSSDAPGNVSDVGLGAEERNRRQQAEIFEQGRQAAQQQLRSEFDAALTQHRDTQIDPHALAGIVRVTLEKLDIGTKVSLHVHPQEAADWRHYFACQVEG